MRFDLKTVFNIIEDALAHSLAKLVATGIITIHVFIKTDRFSLDLRTSSGSPLSIVSCEDYLFVGVIRYTFEELALIKKKIRESVVINSKSSCEPLFDSKLIASIIEWVSCLAGDSLHFDFSSGRIGWVDFSRRGHVGFEIEPAANREKDFIKVKEFLGTCITCYSDNPGLPEIISAESVEEMYQIIIKKENRLLNDHLRSTLTKKRIEQLIDQDNLVLFVSGILSLGTK